MSFSPENNVKNVPPPASEAESGPGAVGATSEPAEVESLDALGKRFKVEGPDSNQPGDSSAGAELQEATSDQAASPEKMSEELNRLKALREQYKNEQEMIKGELAMAMASANIDEVRDTYLRLIESRISGQKNEIEILNVDYATGDFQGRVTNPEGAAGQDLLDKVRGIYESQLTTAETALSDLHGLKDKVITIEMATDLIQVVNREEEGMQYGESMADSLQRIFNEVDEVMGWERQGAVGEYGEYTKKLEGALRRAMDIQQLTPDPRLKLQLDSAVRRYGTKLPADLVAEIETL